MVMVNDSDGDSNNDTNNSDSNSNDNNNKKKKKKKKNGRGFVIETEKNDKKLTKINEIYQDSENPVNHNGPKSTKIARTQLVKMNQK